LKLSLKELASFSDVYFGETFTDSLPLGQDIYLYFANQSHPWQWKDCCGDH
jgi:hypothetical protein